MPSVDQPLLSPGEVTALLRRGARLSPGEHSRISPLVGRVGEHSARRTGSGLDFAETRAFQAGDDPRHIHWRATARLGRMQVRRYHQDVSPTVCCVVDRSPSMRFGTRRRLKVTQAARLALLLAAYEVQRGAELAALLLDGPDPAHPADRIPAESHWLPPLSGPAALRRLATSIVAACPPLEAPPSGVGLARVLTELASRLPEGSRVYLISDFQGLGREEESLLADAGRRFDMRALAVFDRAERELPATGPLLLRWGVAAVSADGRSLEQRAERASAWRDRHDTLKQLFARCGIGLRFIAADAEDLQAALADTSHAD